MSVKRLLPLVAILIGLVGLAVMLKRQQVTPDLVREAGLVSLVPATLRADTIKGVDLYQGAHPQQVVRLRQRNGVWVVSSHANAPGKASSIEALLQGLSTLTGEIRANTPDVLEDFLLDEQHALYIQAYTDNLETPAVSLLAGKGSGRQSFVRRNGETQVYAVGLNLRTMAGLTTEATDLSARPWVDLHLFNVPAEQIDAIELARPEQVVRFERLKTAETPASSPASPPRWAVTSPAGDFVVKQEAVQSLVGTLRTLQGEDLATSTELASAALETSPYRVTLTVQDGEQASRQVQAHLSTAKQANVDKHYARLDDAEVVYRLPQWTWKRLFPALGTLLDLRLVSVPATAITGLTLQHEGLSWSLERPSTATTTGAVSAPGWTRVETPEIAVETADVTALLDTVTTLMADDVLAHAPAASNAAADVLTLILQQEDERTTTLRFTQEQHDNTDVYYASRQDRPDLFVLSADTYQKLAATVTKLRPSGTSSAAEKPEFP